MVDQDIAFINTEASITVGDQEKTCMIRLFGEHLAFIIGQLNATPPEEDFRSVLQLRSLAVDIIGDLPTLTGTEDVFTDLTGNGKETLFEAAAILDDALYTKMLIARGGKSVDIGLDFIKRMFGRNVFRIDTRITSNNLLLTELQSWLETNFSDSAQGYIDAISFLEKDADAYDYWPSIYKDRFVIIKANVEGTEFALIDKTRSLIHFFKKATNTLGSSTPADLGLKNYSDNTEKSQVDAYFSNESGITWTPNIYFGNP